MTSGPLREHLESTLNTQRILKEQSEIKRSIILRHTVEPKILRLVLQYFEVFYFTQCQYVVFKRSFFKILILDQGRCGFISISSLSRIQSLKCSLFVIIRFSSKELKSQVILRSLCIRCTVLFVIDLNIRSPH